MRMWTWSWGLVITFCLELIPGVCLAAYHHQGEQDAGVFLFAYPDKDGMLRPCTPLRVSIPTRTVTPIRWR
jgi:hypothetical protein